MLQQVSIGICTDPANKDEVLESYNISFRFRDDEYSVSNQASTVILEENNPTVQATLMLLKSVLYITEILGPLPKNSYITMKLLFNEETPADYQPPGFEPSDCEKFLFPPNAVKLELGKVTTEFNNYRMFLKTVLSKEPLSQIYEESVLTESRLSQTNEEIGHENGSVPLDNKISPKSDNYVASKQDQEKVECLCGCKEDSDIMILQCRVCEKKQHSICYGILNAHEIKSDFYCTECIGEAPFSSYEADVMYTYGEDEQKELCAFRRALVFCASLKQVTPFQLEKGLKCDKALSKIMIAKLEAEDYIKKNGPKYIVDDKKIIKIGYWMYFRRTEDKENFDSSSKVVVLTKGFDDDDFKKGASTTKRKSDSMMKGGVLPEEEYMDFTIEDEVKKLNLRGSQEKQVKKVAPKRRSLKTAVDEDTKESSQKKPKRRCLNKDETINLK